jgi:DamX protein
MAETNEPVPPEDPQGATPTLVERVAERMRTLGPDDPGATADAAQLATVSAGLASLRVQMRDLEKSLVERIADVDDDRRLTAVQLQRAWQAQREEQEARRQGHGTLIVGTLILIAALGAAGLYGLYRSVQSGQEALDSRVSALRLELDGLRGIGTQDALVEGKIAALSATVEQLAQGLGQGPKPPAQPESPAQLSALEARIERMGAEQTRIDRALADLRGALAARPAAAPVVPPANPAVASSPDATVPPAPPPPDDPTPTAPQGGGAAPADAAAAAAPLSPLQTIPVGDRPFALQILGSSRREELLTHAARLSLPSNGFIRQESRRGRPWYVLIYDLYPTRAEAEEALASLPASLRAPKPWIRRLAPDARVEPIATRTGP